MTRLQVVMAVQHWGSPEPQANEGVLLQRRAVLLVLRVESAGARQGSEPCLGGTSDMGVPPVAATFVPTKMENMFRRSRHVVR